MKKYSRWSLKVKVMLLSLGMMAVMGLITYVMVQVLNKKQQELAQGNMGAYAQGISQAVAKEFRLRYEDILHFSQNSTLALMDGDSIQEELNKYVEAFSMYDVIALYNAEGEFVSSNSKSWDGKVLPGYNELKKNQSTAKWFVETKALRYSEEKAKDLAGAFVEDFQLDPLSTAAWGEPRYGVSFSRGILNFEGKVIAVLTARANFKFVEGEFQEYYRTIKNSGVEAVELTLINSKGQVILDFDPMRNGKSLDMVHDPSVLLNLNLEEKGVEAARSLVKGQTGHGTSYHARKQVEQFTGYASLKNVSGFLSSLNWGVMVRAEEESVLGGIYSSVRPFYFGSVLAFFLAAAVGFWITSLMSAQLVAVSGKLSVGADETFTTSESLQVCSQELAVCSNEQAAAVQETVAAMEEMKSMINQSGEYIRESLQSAKRVSEKTEEGAQIMRQMVDAMEAVQEANGQLQNMANIINEISAKTNVINDIVFKTQLLSFNASIEAARAGQHGRGFAVVAEEVGNLAQMSGAAAKEIKSLLDDSQKQVLQIVEITRNRSQDGQEVSTKAQKAFDEIAQEIKTITSQVESVNDAAREQDNGIQQTSTSMSKLDDATTRSARMGEQISAAADSLGEQSRRLKQIMRATMLLVQGTMEGASGGKAGKKYDFVSSLTDDAPVHQEPAMDSQSEGEVMKILEETALEGINDANKSFKGLGAIKSNKDKILSIGGKIVEKVRGIEKKVKGNRSA